MWPVIVRELRVGARDRWNNWYRVLAAGLILVVGWFTQLFDSTADGRKLFGVVHLILFCMIWIFVPLATADCISKERREGTLGLLFLTPLKAWHVVLAKSLVHANRALLMWLAAIPVLTLSFLMGGITKWEVILSLLIHFSSLCCALAAGIAVSALFREWSRAMVAASFASALLLLGYLEVQLWIAQQTIPPSTFSFMLNHFQVRPLLALVLVTNWPKQIFWMFMGAGTGANLSAIWAKWMILPCAMSALVLVAAVPLSGILVRRSITNQESELPRAVRLCTQVVLFPGLHRLWSRRHLLRNPVGWLQQRTWTARALQWGWVAILIAFFLFIVERLDTGFYRHTDSHRFLGWALLGALGLTAAASLRRERENGMLSLLLITPLPPGTIVRGRVKGLWAQIRWAAALFVAGWIYLEFSHTYLDWFWMLFFTVSYFTLPVTGLFCSLWRKSYFAAVLWTFLLGVAYPFAMACLWALIILLLTGYHHWGPVALAAMAFSQICIACIRGHELVHKLSSRSFTI